MKLPTLLAALATTLPLTAAFPNAPFNTSAQNVVDASGANFTYVGANWPGHGEVMIPEGLQYQSISHIVGKIKSLGMNVVRLTFAIEMVDDIVDRGGDVRVKDAFVKALGSANGTKVWGQVRAKNPGLSENVTRTQVCFFLSCVFLVGGWMDGWMLIVSRFSMLSRRSSASRVSMSIWITTCPRGRGAARPRTETPGSATPTLTLRSGNGELFGWPHM